MNRFEIAGRHQDVRRDVALDQPLQCGEISGRPPQTQIHQVAGNGVEPFPGFEQQVERMPQVATGIGDIPISGCPCCCQHLGFHSHRIGRVEVPHVPGQQLAQQPRRTEGEKVSNQIVVHRRNGIEMTEYRSQHLLAFRLASHHS